MKTRKRKPTKPATVREAETAWPLLTAYLDLAERHAALLAEKVAWTRREAARAEAALLAKLDEEPCEASRIFRAAILNAPAPKLF
jgi:hypothetical protein